MEKSSDESHIKNQLKIKHEKITHLLPLKVWKTSSYKNKNANNVQRF